MKGEKLGLCFNYNRKLRGINAVSPRAKSRIHEPNGSSPSWGGQGLDSIDPLKVW